MSGKPVTFVDVGGQPVTQVSEGGVPVESVDVGGVPLTLVDVGGQPIVVAGFSAVSLFAGGRSGFLIGDAAAFTDIHATDLADTANDAIGFATDVHDGLGYSGGAFTGTGSELIANGVDPVNTTGWTCLSADETDASGRLTAAGNVFVLNVAGASEYIIAYVPISAAAGDQVRLQVEVTARTANRVYFSTSSALTSESAIAQLSPSPGDTALRTYQFVIDAAATTYFRIAVDRATGGSLSFNNVSARVLPGFSGRQASASFKPLLTADGAHDFDGIDDRLETGLTPTTTGTLAVRFRPALASRMVIGSQGASDGRVYLGTAAAGELAGGIGTQATSTIKGSADVRGDWVTGALTWDSTTWRLYQDGAQVNSGAQSGAVNTTVPMVIGAVNANGTPAAFFDGPVRHALAIDRVLTPAEITNLHNFWSS